MVNIADQVLCEEEEEALAVAGKNSAIGSSSSVRGSDGEDCIDDDDDDGLDRDDNDREGSLAMYYQVGGWV